MFLIVKALILYSLIIFLMPLTFFALIAFFGPAFSLTVSKDSWLAKTNIRWIKNLVKRHFV
jgi:hypothetical protein